MDREIKYRVWDKKAKQMIYFAFWELYGLGNVWNKIIFDPDNPKMQSLGKKDKNGKEIYEGDIYEYEVIATMFKDGKGKRRGVVEWIEDRPEGGLIGTYIGFYLDKDPDEIEVIGNKYENSEIKRT